MASAEMAQMGIQVLMNINNSFLAKANAEAQNTVNSANINAQNTVNAANVYASNLVRSATNELRASRGSLARYTQSVNNNRALENTGEQVTAAAVNYRRARDNATKASFEDQIAFAEQAGRQSAQAAFSGLTGGVADIVNGTSALRRARVQQKVDEASTQAAYDAGQRQRAIMLAGFDSLDQSEITDDIDYNTDVVQRRVAPVASAHSSFLADLLIGQDPKALANVSSEAYSWFKSKTKD